MHVPVTDRAVAQRRPPGGYALDAYAPDPSWWSGNPWGSHGVNHAARVLVWADRLAAAQQAAGLPIDRAVVRWAAVLHDCRRQHDGADPAHGARAALWVGVHAATLAPELTPAQVRAVQHAVAWHVPPDAACPTPTRELWCLKDADSLDRVRFGDCDPRYLRLPASPAYQGPAATLAAASWAAWRAGDRDSWGTVRRLARAQGWWR